MGTRLVVLSCLIGVLIPLSSGAATSQFDLQIMGFVCFDGIDNDNDGLVDFPNDPGCQGQNDNDETDPSLPETAVSGSDTSRSGTRGRSGTRPDESVQIRIDTLPNPAQIQDFFAEPVLLPPTPSGEPFNPQRSPGPNSGVGQVHNSEQGRDPAPPKASQDRNDSSSKKSDQDDEGGGSKYEQPLLPALEVSMEFGDLMQVSALGALDGGDNADDVPIHSPHSPLVPLFVLLGTLVSVLSVVRIVFVFV